MIKIEMKVWTMWVLGAILLLNAITVAIDIIVRLRTCKILWETKSE